MNETPPTADESRDVRGFVISILVGAVIGGAHGVVRYGAVSIFTVNLVGLGVILSVSAYALIVALLPARGASRHVESSPPR